MIGKTRSFLLFIVSFIIFLDSYSIEISNRYRYVARVMYDGTRFNGWQDMNETNQSKSGHILSIQSILKSKLSERFSKDINVIGASRTDAGVHARGQMIHFDRDIPIKNIDNFEFTMNRVLPDDIRICNVTLAPESVNGKKWHATSSALGKYYSYTFCTNKYVDPMLRRYCGHMYFPIDIDLFKYSLSLFKGTHNFAAFSNHVDRKKREFELKDREFSTFKTIHSIDLIHLDAPGYYRVDIQLNSALYRMIRNIIWTCGHVAHGRMTTSQLEELLVDDQPEIAARSRNTAKPAPPEGLCLEKVYYEHFP